MAVALLVLVDGPFAGPQLFRSAEVLMSVRPGFAAAVLALAAALACQHAGPAPGGGPVIVENGGGGVVFPATDAALPGLDGGLELDAGMPGLDGGVIMSFDAG